MKRVKVGFWGIDSILEFVKITGSSRHKMELVCGSTVVDAKSLLSVLSVKAAQAVELVIHEEKLRPSAGAAGPLYRAWQSVGQGPSFECLTKERKPPECISAGPAAFRKKTDRKRNLKN